MWDCIIGGMLAENYFWPSDHAAWLLSSLWCPGFAPNSPKVHSALKVTIHQSSQYTEVHSAPDRGTVVIAVFGQHGSSSADSFKLRMHGPVAVHLEVVVDMPRGEPGPANTRHVLIQHLRQRGVQQDATLVRNITASTYSIPPPRTSVQHTAY